MDRSATERTLVDAARHGRRPQVGILGSIEVRSQDALISIGGGRQRRLVAILAAHAGRVVGAHTVAEYLWDDDERPVHTRQAIRTYVSRLRRTLRESGLDAEHLVVTEPPGYRLALEEVDLDSVRFEQLVLFARSELDRAAYSSARDALTEAIELWRGDPLVEFGDCVWAEPEITRLSELIAVATEQRCEAQILLGAHAEAVADLKRLVADNELRSRAVELLVTALHRCGRKAEALRAASQYRRVLRDVGLDPATAFVELERQIACTDGQPESGHSRDREAAERSRLPRTPTRFIGRVDEVRTLSAALPDGGLLTLLGVGGVGKSRLAIRAATLTAAEFRDGVWYCDLSAHEQPADVAGAVASALHVHVAPRHTVDEAIVNALAERQLLLVLDSCEHLVDAVAALAQRLLATCPCITVLATSREALGVAGERVWPIAPMDVDTDAIDLFCQRATEADVSFDPTEEASAIAELCRRVDGLPLAIELAAGRIRSSSVADLCDQLDDRFQILQGRRRSAVARHQTLRAAIDWSFRLLTDDQQTLFTTLTVLPGSFDLSAARLLGSIVNLRERDIVDLLNALVDQSMVVAERSSIGATYALHESLRQYGLERIEEGDRERLIRASAQHVLSIVRHGNGQLTGDDWHHGTALIAQHWTNVGSLIGWALEQDDVDLAADLVEATSWYGALKVRHEHRRWTTATLAAAERLRIPSRPSIVGISAWWSVTTNSDPSARAVASAAIETAPSTIDPSTNWCWHALLLAAMYDRDWPEYERALEGWGRANANPSDRFHRSLMAAYRTWHGPPADRQEGVRLAAELAQQTNNPSVLIWRSWATGIALTNSADQDRATASHRATLELARAAGHDVMEVTACVMLSISLYRGRRLDPDAHRVILETVRRTGLQVGPSISALARLLLHHRHEEPAAVLFGHLERQSTHLAVILPILQDLREHRPTTTTYVERGAALTRTEMLDYATTVLEQIKRTTQEVG